MGQTKMLRIFNDEYFPIGSAIRVTKIPQENENEFDAISCDCLVRMYQGTGTIMKVALINPINYETTYRNLKIEELDKTYSIEKLEPFNDQTITAFDFWRGATPESIIDQLDSIFLTADKTKLNEKIHLKLPLTWEKVNAGVQILREQYGIFYKPEPKLNENERYWRLNENERPDEEDKNG